MDTDSTESGHAFETQLFLYASSDEEAERRRTSWTKQHNLKRIY